MPRALAIETSGRVGSVAVVDGNDIVAQETFPHGLKNAAGIVPILDRLVRARGWKPGDVEQLYLSIGPGSFTGLRIGVTLAKTFALATGAKLVAVPTVRVLAANALPDAKHLIIVLDAKRDQIFTARFERDEDAWVQREDAHLDTLPAMLDRSPRPVHLLGEGIPFHGKFIPTEEDGIVISPQATWQARAEVVARIGLTMAASGEFVDAMRLTPLYVRKPEAEEKYEQAHPQKSSV